MNILESKTAGVFSGVTAPDRETLVSAYQIRRSNVHGEPYLRIVLPCGNVREYLIADNVPRTSIRCNCGEIDEEHWFIRYDMLV